MSQSPYEVTVYVLNDGQGGFESEVWASRKGSGSKTDAIQFVNTRLIAKKACCDTGHYPDTDNQINYSA